MKLLELNNRLELFYLEYETSASPSMLIERERVVMISRCLTFALLIKADTYVHIDM